MASDIARSFGARRVLILLAVLLGARLLSLPLYPLLDRTESRYGEIARQMDVTQDWATPRLHGEPFWGKPPLSTWAQAAGIGVFGRNEFGVRLPAWLAGLLTVWLVWKAGLLLGGRLVAAGGALLFCCSPISMFLIGGVMTDPYLVLGTTIALYGVLARAVPPPEERAGAWRSAITVAVGFSVATLAKGPLGVVLGGSPFVGLLFGSAGRAALRSWPWLRTVAIFSLLTLPWFLLAEQRTPGFLEYFIVGEHFRRFLDSNWAGDRYGFVHNEPRGMIWLHMLLACVAWLPIAWTVLRRELRNLSVRALAQNPGWAAAAASLLTPLVFFTFSRNILPTYVYPAMPAGALLLSHGIRRGIDHSRYLRFGARAIPAISAAVAVVVLVALPFVPNAWWLRQSHREIVAEEPAALIVYARDLHYLYSALFYSDGRAVGVAGQEDPHWDEVRARSGEVVVVSKKRHLDRVPEDIRARLELARNLDDYYEVWRVRPEGD